MCREGAGARGLRLPSPPSLCQDSRLRSAASLLQQALNAEDVAKEEELW